MPIRPENRDRYPADWPAIRARILQRAGWRCEWANPITGRRCVARHNKCGMWSGGQWLAWCDGARVVLTIAHLDHQPEHNADDNLRAYCQRHHLWHDRHHHQATRWATARAGAALGDLFA